MTGEKILIVEDERAVARGLEYGLRDAGFEVQWAENGLRALSLAEEWNPHLIALDIRLPDISGYGGAGGPRLSGSAGATTLAAAGAAVVCAAQGTASLSSCSLPATKK